MKNISQLKLLSLMIVGLFNCQIPYSSYETRPNVELASQEHGSWGKPMPVLIMSDQQWSETIKVLPNFEKENTSNHMKQTLSHAWHKAVKDKNEVPFVLKLLASKRRSERNFGQLCYEKLTQKQKSLIKM